VERAARARALRAPRRLGRLISWRR
jgi:hypothetical protein